jgi:UDP-N-acetylglucosamine diphosphorylase/glucosamine-1-phosphate N-acetyltransferase
MENWKEALPNRPAGGYLVDAPWDLVERNADALRHDFAARTETNGHAAGPGDLTVVGPRERLVVDPTAQVEPLAVVDTTRGPVLIDRGAVVQSFSRLEGPCYVGPESWILGAKVRGSTIGPACRVGGEVEACILQGFSNKYHEGFLGHSYLGEWVNLGAGTQVSDLRNDYEPVKMTVAGTLVQTGMRKLGAFIGDHTKTGMATLLNTGTVVGAFCQLLPSGSLLPRVIPSFCTAWRGVLQDRAHLRQLFWAAATVMSRRNQEWTDVHTDFFFSLYEQTNAQRRQVIWQNDQVELRRSV